MKKAYVQVSGKQDEMNMPLADARQDNHTRTRCNSEAQTARGKPHCMSEKYKKVENMGKSTMKQIIKSTSKGRGKNTNMNRALGNGHNRSPLLQRPRGKAIDRCMNLVKHDI